MHDDTNFYFMNSHPYTHAFDQAVLFETDIRTGEKMVHCPLPGCMHDTPECTAYLRQDQKYYAYPDRVFYTDKNKLYQVNGTTKELIYENKEHPDFIFEKYPDFVDDTAEGDTVSTNFYISDVNFSAEQNLCYISYSGQYTKVIDPETGECLDSMDIWIDVQFTEKMTFVCSSTYQVLQYDLDFKDCTPLLDASERVTALSYSEENQRLYFCNDAGTLYSCRTDGTDKKKIASSIGRPIIEDKYIYYSKPDSTNALDDIWRMDLNGENAEKLIEGYNLSDLYRANDKDFYFLVGTIEDGIIEISVIHYDMEKKEIKYIAA